MEINQQRNDEMDFDLRDIISVLISRLGIIILSGVFFALLVVVGTKLFITPKYESVTKMYVLSKQSSETLTNGDLQTSLLLTKDYAELIKSRTVTEAVIGKLGLKEKHEELIKKIEVATTTDTRIITIKVSDEDPYMARDIANTVRDTAAEHIQKVMDSEAVNIVDEANIPDEQATPSAVKNGVIAGILGCFLAAAIILIRHLTNDTIKTADDVERYLQLSILGTIPLERV